MKGLVILAAYVLVIAGVYLAVDRCNADSPAIRLGWSFLAAGCR